jgi:hypothetical protein
MRKEEGVEKERGGVVMLTMGRKTETETSFLKFTGCVIARNEARFCTVHLLRVLSQPDLQSVERRKKTNRSVSCI